MTDEEIIRHAAELGGEKGTAFLATYFDDHPESVVPAIRAVRNVFYEHITMEWRPGTPEDVKKFLVHLKEALLS